MLKNRFFAHLALLSATLLYGANYRVAKNLMPIPLNPFGFIMLRLIGAGVLFWVLHALFVRERVRRSDMGRLVLCGIFGAMANMLLFFEGLSLTTPVSAALIMMATPILVLLISYAIGSEKMSWTRMIGVLVGLMGATLLVGEQGLDAGRGEMLGNLMVFANGVFYALYLIMVRPLMQRYQPLTVVKWVFLFGLLSCAVLATDDLLAISLLELSSLQWASLGFVVIGATAMSYLLNITAMKVVKASMVGYYVYVQPIFAMIIDVIWQDANLSVIKITGGLMIFAGIYIIEQRYQRTKR